MTSSAEHPPQAPPEQREFVVRRAPRIGVFMASGAALGLIAALLVTTCGPQNPEFTFATTFGFFFVLFAVVGAALGSLVWLVLDRRSRKKMYTVHAESVQDPSQADVALRGTDVQQWRDRWENEDRDSQAR